MEKIDEKMRRSEKWKEIHDKIDFEEKPSSITNLDKHNLE